MLEAATAATKHSAGHPRDEVEHHEEHEDEDPLPAITASLGLKASSCAMTTPKPATFRRPPGALMAGATTAHRAGTSCSTAPQRALLRGAQAPRSIAHGLAQSSCFESEVVSMRPQVVGRRPGAREARR